MTTVTVHFDNTSIVPALLAEATARGCRPQQLAVALVRLTLEGGMVDAVLDGEDPAKIAPNAGLRGRKISDPLSLTDIQRQSLAAIAAAGGAGCAISITEMAETLGKNRGQARRTLQALIHRGLIVRVAVGAVRGVKSIYRVTLAGRAALAARSASSAGVLSRSETSEATEPQT